MYDTSFFTSGLPRILAVHKVGVGFRTLFVNTCGQTQEKTPYNSSSTILSVHRCLTHVLFPAFVRCHCPSQPQYCPSVLYVFEVCLTVRSQSKETQQTQCCCGGFVLDSLRAGTFFGKLPLKTKLHGTVRVHTLARGTYAWLSCLTAE